MVFYQTTASFSIAICLNSGITSYNDICLFGEKNRFCLLRNFGEVTDINCKKNCPQNKA